MNALGLGRRRLEARAGDTPLLPDAPLLERATLSHAERERLAELIRIGFAEGEKEKARLRGASIITLDDERYPELLRNIHDPPEALYVEGDPRWISAPSIGLVGSRFPTPYGRSAAESLAFQLASRGICVTSGFARGIDASAHSACLKAGGGTVAVLGCGLDIDYPKGHEHLRASILGRGCLVTEFPFGIRPSKTTFPRRNRIISGLSLGVVVVEAGDKSGALVTARHAMEQGREVFAVPGSVFSPMSRGPHRLIRDGAKLVESVEDILEEVECLRKAEPMAGPGPGPGEGTVEARVLSVIGPEGNDVDALSHRLALAVPQLMSVLMVLELKRCVERMPGNRFRRT